MNPEKTATNVIHVANRFVERRCTDQTRYQKAIRPETRVIAITSGKGGVGKTNIVANLGYAFSRQGKKVLIVDADWGLGNLDVLLGMAPRYNLSHVIMGEKQVPDILLDGPGNMQILPASSGIQELTDLTANQKIHLLTQLDQLMEEIDILLIDTAAGISSNVMDFNVSAKEILVVVSPEPTSLTDAYALMKVLSIKYAAPSCKLVVNMAANTREAMDIYRQLNMVVEKFLNISVEYMGCVLFDDKLPRGVKRQKIISQLYPSAKASRSFSNLARKLAESSGSHPHEGDSHFIWDHLYRTQVT